MWSVGVILAELLGGKPIFKGRECVLVSILTKLPDPVICVCSYVDQFIQILHCLGTPSDETLHRIGSPGVSSHALERAISSSDWNFKAQHYVRSLPVQPGIPFSTLFPHANPQAIDLLSQLLCFDPTERITAQQALIHPYFEGWYDPDDQPVCEPMSRALSILLFHLLVLTHGFSRNSIPGSRKSTILKALRGSLSRRSSHSA